MFVGAGLSPLMNLDLALAAFILYLFLTINVSINAHLKSEFRLTYAKLGSTEFRLLIVISNTVLVASPSIAAAAYTILGFSLTLLDIVAIVVIALLACIYLITVISDARHYARIDPPHKGV